MKGFNVDYPPSYTGWWWVRILQERAAGEWKRSRAAEKLLRICTDPALPESSRTAFLKVAAHYLYGPKRDSRSLLQVLDVWASRPFEGHKGNIEQGELLLVLLPAVEDTKDSLKSVFWLSALVSAMEKE